MSDGPPASDRAPASRGQHASAAGGASSLESLRIVVLSQVDAILSALRTTGGSLIGSNINIASITQQLAESESVLRSLRIVAVRPLAFSGLLEQSQGRYSCFLSSFLSILRAGCPGVVAAVVLSSLSKLLGQIPPRLFVFAEYEELVLAVIRCGEDCLLPHASSGFVFLSPESGEVVLSKVVLVMSQLIRLLVSSSAGDGSRSGTLRRSPVSADEQESEDHAKKIQLVSPILFFLYKIASPSLSSCRESLRRSAEHILAEATVLIFSLSPTTSSDPATSLLDAVGEFVIAASDSSLGLGLAITIFETLGTSVPSLSPRLLSLMSTELFRNILVHLSSNAPSIAPHALRCLYLMMCSLRSCLEPQIECLFGDVLPPLLSTQPNAVHFSLFDFLGAVFSHPSLPFFLFSRFDALSYRIDLVEGTARLLSKWIITFAEAASPAYIQTCLDVLLVLVQSTSNAVASRSEMDHHLHLAQAEMVERAITRNKEVKEMLAGMVDLFNSSPKKALLALQEQRLLGADSESHVDAMLTFLKCTSGLDPGAIGDFLGEFDEFTIRLLGAFAGSLDFAGMRIDHALRYFLSFFRLPGEAQKIDRVVENFANRFVECNPDFASKDGAYVLAFAIIMLQTDLHNPQVKAKMTLEGFLRNNRGVNDGKDFDAQLLERIYMAIRDEPLKVPSSIHRYRWREVVRPNRADELRTFLGNPLEVYEHQAVDFVPIFFKAVSSSAVAALYAVFEASTPAGPLHGYGDGDESDELASFSSESACRGILQCAATAFSFRRSDVIDKLLVAMLRSATIPPLNDPKARLALDTAFDIARRCGDQVREAWRNIMEVVLRLVYASLLDVRLMLDEDVPSRMWKAYSPGMEIAHPQYMREVTELLFVESKFLEAESLVYLVRAVISVSAMPSSSGSGGAAGSAAAPSVSGAGGNGGVSSASGAAASVLLSAVGSGGAGQSGAPFAQLFSVEVLFKMLLSNRDRVVLLWDDLVGPHIATILGNSQSLASAGLGILVERTALGILRVGTRLMHSDAMRNKLYDALCELAKIPSQGMPFSTYAVILQSLCSDLLTQTAKHINSAPAWRSIFMLLRSMTHAVLLFLDAKRGIATTCLVQSLGDAVLSVMTRCSSLPNVVEDAADWMQNTAEMILAVGIDTVSSILGVQRRAEEEEEVAQRLTQLVSLIAENLFAMHVVLNKDGSPLGTVPIRAAVKIAIAGHHAPDVQILVISHLLRLVYSMHASKSEEAVVQDALLELLRNMSTTSEDALLRLLTACSKLMLHLLTSQSLTESGSVAIWREFLSLLIDRVCRITKMPDSVAEALPELLKNMILVLASQHLFGEEMEAATMELVHGRLKEDSPIAQSILSVLEQLKCGNQQQQQRQQLPPHPAVPGVAAAGRSGDEMSESAVAAVANGSAGESPSRPTNMSATASG